MSQLSDRELQDLRNAGNEAAMAAEEIEQLRDTLRRNGFVRCDVPACNCGGYHARFGLRERFEEFKQALSDADHPLSNENGNLALGALQGLIAERDALRKDAARYRWLRAQHWDEAPPLAVVAGPKSAVKLGHCLPSLDHLDARIDAAIAAAEKGAK